jgi:hypothetical protein
LSRGSLPVCCRARLIFLAHYNLLATEKPAFASITAVDSCSALDCETCQEDFSIMRFMHLRKDWPTLFA